jgi:uncharacterized membrane protein
MLNTVVEFCKVTVTGADPEGFVGLLEPPFWTAVFNFHEDFGQKAGNYYVTTLGNHTSNPG